MAGTGFSFSGSSSSSSFTSPFGFSNPSSASSAPSFGLPSAATPSASTAAPSFSATSSSSPFAFGTGAASSSAASAPSFGFGSNPSPASTPSFGFSSNPSTASSASPFGSSTFGASSASAATPNLFGSSFGASSGGAPTSSIFGSSASGTAPTSSPFGSATPTPAPSTPPPSSSPFGAPSNFGSPATGSSNLFGSGAPTPSLFGNTSSASSAATVSNTTTPSLFGSSTPSTASAFGSGLALNTGKFGSFGTAPAAAATTAPQFGASTTPSLFGSSASASTGGNLFGASIGSTTGSNALFGSTLSVPPSTTSSSSSSPATVFSFPSSVASTPGFSVSSSSSAAPATGFSFPSASASTSAAPGFSLPASSSSSASAFSFLAASASTNSSTGFSFLKSTASTASSASATTAASSSPGFSFSSAPSLLSTSASANQLSLFSTATTTTATTASAPASTSASSAGTAASSGLTFPALTTSTPGTTVSAPTSGFTGFGVASTPASSSGSSSSFSLSFKSPSTAASSSQAQSSAALPSFGVTAASSTPTLSLSTSSAAQTSSTLVAASSSGTALASSTALATAPASTPKLPSEITGRTVEEIIKEWNAELQECTGKFRKQAEEEKKKKGAEEASQHVAEEVATQEPVSEEAAAPEVVVVEPLGSQPVIEEPVMVEPEQSVPFHAVEVEDVPSPSSSDADIFDISSGEEADDFDEEAMHAEAHLAEERVKKEQSRQLLYELEGKAAAAVDEMMPGIGLTRKTRNLAIRLRLLLDVKDYPFHTIQSLMGARSFDDWKVEEVVLMEELCYRSIAHARSDFRRLVLTQMKKEAKALGVDLKPYFHEEPELYNSAVPTDHSAEFSLILDVVVRGGDKEGEEAEGDQQGVRSSQGAGYSAELEEFWQKDADVPIFITPREIEKIICAHSEKALKEFDGTVQSVGKTVDAKLEKWLSEGRASVTALKEDLKATEERLQEKIASSSSSILAEAVNTAKELATATAAQQIAKFVEEDLKGKVGNFLGDLLKSEDVASLADLNALSGHVKDMSEAQTTLIGEITRSASAANQKEEVMKGDISSLYKTDETLKIQLSSLQAEVQNLIGVINTLSDDVKKEEEEKENAKEKSSQKKEKKAEKKKKKTGDSSSSRSSPPVSVELDDQTVAAAAHTIEQLILAGADATQAVDSAVQKRHVAEQAAKTAAHKQAVKAMIAEEKQVSKVKAEEDRRRRQVQANLQHLNAKYINRKVQTLEEGKDWMSRETRAEWEDFVSSFILQHYWIKLPPYGGEDNVKAFSQFLRDYHNQALLKKVKEIANAANVKIKVPPKQTFIPPLLPDQVHVDYTVVDENVRNIALILGVPIGDNEAYKSIRSGLYASMDLVPREEVKKDLAASSSR